MIRYAITEQKLLELIEAERPGWLARAKRRTARLIKIRHYRERSAIWGEIKAVFLRLQHNKCAYCERRLASGEVGGSIEHDVEHFRPKGSIDVWPVSDSVARYRFATGARFDSGYYWLAYDPTNFCTACKVCNSVLKRNSFPILRERGRATASPAELDLQERPLLLFPIGTRDDDPEEVLEFLGINARPRHRRGVRNHRARVTIDLFGLEAREDLRRERAEALAALHNALVLLEHDLDTESAMQDIRRLRSASSPHASCVRSACRLYESTPELAIELFQAARDFLKSYEP